MATSDSPLSVPNITLEVARQAGTGSTPNAPADGETFWGPYVNIAHPAATIFSDDFSTGDLSTLGASGLATWGNSSNQRATSLVNTDGCVVFDTSGNVVDPPNCGFEYKQWEGLTNNTAMRFRYGVDAAFPMQSWTLGQPATRVRDIWFRFPIRVPLDYEHVNNSGSSTNNKFFALFMDGRETNSDGGATVVFQTRMRSSDVPANVGSSMTFYVWNNQDGNGEYPITDDFWSVPAVDGNGARDDRLRWMDIVLHVVANDGARATGKVQVFRRWQDEADYALLAERTIDIPIPNSGYDGWQFVQILGGDNSWLAESTEVLIDGFYVSDQPLVPAGTEGL